MSVGYALRNAHEYVFQVDLFFLQQLEPKVALHQEVGNETDVFGRVFQRHAQHVIGFLEFDRLHVWVSLEVPARCRVQAVCDRDQAHQALPRSMMPILLQMSASSGRMWLETRIVLPMLRSSLSNPRISIRARGSSPEA